MKGGQSTPYAVPTHDDGGVLRSKYLHDLEDSVRARTPLAGNGINIVRTDLGATIGIANATTCQVLQFNVCSNGTPEKIAILCVVTKPGYDIYDPTEKISYVPISTSY